MSKCSLIVAAIATQLFCIAPTMAESVKFEIAEFTVEGNTLLSEEAVHKALAPFTGREREMADVERAAVALRARYQQAGYAVVQVIPPAQTVSGGKVRLKVIEDKVVSVEVKGNTAYQADNIRASLPALQVGKSLNADRLEAAITLANENAAKQVAVNVQPGAQPGALVTRIDVSEDRISRWMTSMDNTGSAATGFAKLGITYQNANLFNRDHALTLQYSGSPETPDKIGSVNVGYHLPLYAQGISLDLIAAYSSSATQNGAIYFAGKGTVLGARLNYALSSWGDLRHKVIVGGDIKASNNSFTACVAPCGSVTEQPISLMYYAQLARPTFQGNGSLAFVSNLTSAGQNNVANYLAARTTVAGATLLASPSWNLWRATLTGSVALPQDWQMRAAVNSQYSKDLLLPAEQLGVGGANSVRGYPERVTAGERGYYANLELYSPDLNKYLNIPDESIRALLFWDNARVTLNDQPLASPHTFLSSFGLGVRVVHRKDVNLKLDLGWAQRPVPYLGGSVKKNDVRGHMAVSLMF